MKLLATSGAYQAKDVIANLQRCINYYPEVNPEKTKASVPITHYQRPGKVRLSSPPAAGLARLLWVASNGEVFAVVGNTVYYIDPTWAWNILGNIAVGEKPCSMDDNGQFAGGDIVLVDGTTTGYQIDMTTRVMTVIVDGTGLFQGADIVKFLQTFLLFNVPNTQNWITSLSDSVTFNALDIAAKASHADNLVTIGLRQREVWLLGEVTTEPWSLTGGADFPFEEIPSTFIQYGCAAKYSLCSADINLYWVAKNAQGRAIIVKSEGYDAKRISTHAIENEIQRYTTVADAVGSAYQIEGHTFVVFTFPSGNTTWAYDLATDQWHELAWTDGDGNLNRDRALFYASTSSTAGYDGSVIALDWENGDLYRADPEVYNDFDGPVTYLRGFPHLMNEMNRMSIGRLVVDIDCGNIVDPAAEMPMLNLRYSDNRGHTFSDVLSQPLGLPGEYDTSPQFNQLGMARDKVIEVWHSANAKAALNGLYVDDLDEAET